MFQGSSVPGLGVGHADLVWATVRQPSHALSGSHEAARGHRGWTELGSSCRVSPGCSWRVALRRWEVVQGLCCLGAGRVELRLEAGRQLRCLCVHCALHPIARLGGGLQTAARAEELCRLGSKSGLGCGARLLGVAGICLGMLGGLLAWTCRRPDSSGITVALGFGVSGFRSLKSPDRSETCLSTGMCRAAAMSECCMAQAWGHQGRSLSAQAGLVGHRHWHTSRAPTSQQIPGVAWR